MNTKKIAQFIKGGVHFFFIQNIIWLILLFTTVETFGECSNTWLNNREQDGIRLLILGVLVSILLTISTFLILDKPTRPFGIGSFLSSLISLSFVVVIALNYFNFDYYYQEFSEKRWKSAKEGKPFKMAVYMVKSEFLKDKSKQEIIQLLGASPSENDEHSFHYRTTDYYSPFVITFKNDKVHEYYLVCIDSIW